MLKTRIFITCPKGLVPFLKQELLALKYPVLSEHIAGVETEGGFIDALVLNLFLRTGHRVLFQLASFPVDNTTDLYKRLSNTRWESFIPEDGYVCVTASVANVNIKDPRYAALKCKDAIVDRIREKRGRRPDAGPERNRSVVHLYWNDGWCIVYLDTSGEPLSRRGYRKIPLRAPMQETLAAAVVLATGWKGGSTYINPMCGSGTLAIEAALIGLNRAPGLLRKNYGFMHIIGFQEAVWQKLREKARKDEKKILAGRIIATDLDPSAIATSRKNAKVAGVEHAIEFSACNFSDTPIPTGKGVVVLNPEYGERMGERTELMATYKSIGDFLKQRCQGYTGFVFTGSPGLAKKVGLKAKQSWQLFNSNIECSLYEYDLYAGSKKIKTGIQLS